MVFADPAGAVAGRAWHAPSSPMATRRPAAPPAPPAPPKPTHLAASMRVVASHLHMRRVTIDTARDEVLQAAEKVKSGATTPKIETLVARLEKVTGASIAELAGAAERWREV
jgi:hypothetical protein